MVFEHKKEEVLPVGEFIHRLVLFGTMAFGVLVAALSMGVCGYHYLGNLPWLDALVNASMILGGMGPVDPITTVSGKLFSSFYALFSGLVFVLSFGLIASPVVHRVLHKFHVDEEDLPS